METFIPAGVAAVRTSNRAAYDHISRQETLEYGIARFNPDYPRVESCNFAAEVSIDDPTAPAATGDALRQAHAHAAPRAIDEVNAFFAARGLACYRWIPAAHQDPNAIAEFLEPRGFVREESVAMLLGYGPRGLVDEKVKFVSARAMRRALTDILHERAAEHFAGQTGNGPGPESLIREWFEVEMGRLDDPQYDAFIAVVNDRPAGMVAVHQVGEIGRIRDLYVLRDARRLSLGTAILNYAIAASHRWAMRTMCTEIAADNAAAIGLFESLGFQQAGRLIQFRSPASTQPPVY